LGIHINTVNSSCNLGLHLIFGSTLQLSLDYNDPHQVSLSFNILHRLPHTMTPSRPSILLSQTPPFFTSFNPPALLSLYFERSLRSIVSVQTPSLARRASLPPIIASFYLFPLRVFTPTTIYNRQLTLQPNNHNGIRRTQERGPPSGQPRNLPLRLPTLPRHGYHRMYYLFRCGWSSPMVVPQEEGYQVCVSRLVFVLGRD
jgi:hypothetical protein